MIAGTTLIFAVPMIVAALLISPTAIHNLIHSAQLYAVVGLIVPIAAWRTFLIEFAFPRAADARLAAVLRVWVLGTVMTAAIFILLGAMADYSPDKPGPNPTADFLLAGFVVCMFISCGLWGALIDIAAEDCAWRSIDHRDFTFPGRRHDRISRFSIIGCR